MICMQVEELVITMEINLVIDVKKERVILAESNSDFIDVLFSFLTLPLGTIVRILDKQSSLGCMDRLYDSVQKLDIDYFSTEACKTMLLAPRSVSDLRCEHLKLRPDDSYPRSIYICETPDCFNQRSKPCSREPHTVCSQCGHTMTHYYSSIDRIACELHVDKEKDHINIAKEKKEENGGVFVLKGGTFLVTDDLYVMQSSTKNTLAEMQKHGIKNFDSCPLEQRKVTLQRSTVLDILKNSWAGSKTVLTNVFLKERKLEQNGNGVAALEVISRNISPLSHLRKSRPKQITVKLQRNKTNGDIVYVEAGADLVDYLFSFLTLTLGGVVNLSDGVSGIGSIDNLYQSVRELHYLYKCITSEQCLWDLTVPIVASHYRCDNQLLEIGEDYWFALRAFFPPRDAAPISKMSMMTLVDPKSPVCGSKGRGRFMKGSNKFLVTDAMCVYPFRGLTAWDIMKKSNILHLGDMEEETITLGEAEVRNNLLPF
ncbi:hypothetical protein ZIOFF_020204 [Zingiber officinale]|uniref:Uncharacterized protein n=1 Tax=Zingiber officinale TaxID=94328 RepID=A0A8J5HF70_ZINOF|nr:hypothetical protein ZIOFF_020204 [Zingiber officinale]